MTRRTFEHIRPGDVVCRLLAGRVPRLLTVTAVDGELIHCGPWTFDRDSGVEVDEELGWGPGFGISGSYLVHLEATEHGEH